MANSESDQVEWVSAKAQCTAGLMFERLRAGVKQDVDRRNALLVIDDAFRFEFSEDAEGFEVARLQASRLAHRTSQRWCVSNFVVGKALYAEWEVRRLALELLFFDEPETMD